MCLGYLYPGQPQIRLTIRDAINRRLYGKLFVYTGLNKNRYLLGRLHRIVKLIGFFENKKFTLVMSVNFGIMGMRIMYWVLCIIYLDTKYIIRDT